MQFFLDNSLDQRPDQAITLAAIGEVCKNEYSHLASKLKQLAFQLSKEKRKKIINNVMD